MLPYRCLRDARGCLRKLAVFLALAFIVLAQLLFFGTASADPYPPTWGPIGTAPTSAVHFSVVPWPNEPVNPANCGESCGDWLPYRYFGSTVNDPRIQDPSNGGTAPQNYVNISSSCVDQAKPSVYYYLDKVHNTLLFRWRVEQIANNYATGPNPSTQVTDNPWNSALWTVFFDLNGDGYRDFAAHLNGSSGDPSSQVDRLQGIWGNVPSNQSLDYVSDPNIHLLKHNPTGFVDSGTGRLLNFNNSLTPSALWPNGASERTWDYGTSRSRIVSQANVDGATCNEYFVDYQIPMGLLDASNYPDAPKIDDNTPLSMLFCTANSLNNPFQKDCAYNGAWVADPSQPAPFGDYLTLGGGLIYQPIVDKVQANGCGPVNLATTVKDTLYTAGNVAATSVKGVDFYYFTDANGNGLADDAGSTWTLATSATASALNMWQATWNNIPNLNGSYLIGVQAIDDGSRTSGGMVNRTFSYLTPAEVEQIAGQAPPGENWAANPAVTGAQSTALYLNTCGVPQPYISKAAGAATVSAGSSVAFTLTVHNTLSTALAVNSIQDALPPGFTFVSFDSLSLGSPSAIPSVGASGTITWAFSTPVSVPPGSTLRLVFHARAPSIAGTYSNVAAATTGSGTLVSDPVQVSVGTPRLTIAKAANVETLKPTDVVTYTITYANNSPVNVTGAVITDVVPAGLSNITPLDGGVYVSSSRTLTWTIGAIASGAGPYTVRFAANVDSPYGGANPSVNTASIDAVETDPASASSSTFINYPAPQLVLQKSASPTLIDAGKDVTFTLRYQNSGNADATGVVITDTIPAGFSFVSATSGGVNTNGTVQWTVGTVEPFASNKVDLVLRANASYTATNPQTNTAWIRSVETAAVSASAKVGINTTGQACTTYYFQKDTITVSNTQELRATQTKPVSTTIGWSGTLVTAPASTNPFSETLRFYQDPAATTDIAIAGNITTTFYVDRNPGNGVDLHATVYDYNPVTGYRTSLGDFVQAYGGNSLEPMTFAVPSNGTLRKGHRLLWVVDVLAANKSPVEVLIQYGGTVTNTLSAPATTSYAESRSTLCVTPPANLSLQKQVNKQQVTLGDTVVYTLTFANSGSTGVTNAKITDTLPSGLTYQGAALNGAAVTPAYNSGQTVVFVVNSPLKSSGVITATAGGTLVITGVVASSLPMATTSLLNQATLESDQTLPVTASAASSVVQPDLSVAKHASQSLLAPGDTVIYTMAVQNTGTYTATNVTISDTLPATDYYNYAAGSTLVNSGVAADSVTGSLLSVNVGSVGPGATAIVAFSMRVASSGVPDGVTVLSNTAAVTSTQTAAKTSQTVDVFISTNPNLAISKKIEPAGSLAPGDLVTYTLMVTNTGRGDALNVEVIDPLPDNAAYVFGALAFDGSARTEVQDTDNARFEAPNNRVRFTIGTLTQGQAHTMVFHARVVAPLPNGISLVDNLAYASASNAATKDAFVSSLATAAPSLTLDKQGPSVVAYPAAKVVTTAAATTTVDVDSTAQLMVGQYVSINGQQRKIIAIDGHKITVASSLSVTAGQAVVGSFTYDIAYRNAGDAAASSAAVVDTLPASLTLIETSPTAQVTGSGLTWDVGTLDPDETGVLRVVVLPTASGVLTNSAVLDSSETDPITDTVVTTAGGLIVSKRTTTPSVEQTPSGTAATYVVEIQNTLATAASGVIVTDTLPPGFLYQAAVGTPTGGTRSPSTPAPAAGSAQPSWGTFSIPANSTLAITFTASISAEAGAATYQNALFATATNVAVTQFDELSTQAEDVTVLLPQVILAKTVTPSQVTAGDMVTYTITAQNVGGAPARTLQISDVLPSGFSYAGSTLVSTLAATRTSTANPTVGDVRPAWGAWDIAPGGTLTLTFAVDTAHSAGTYYNDVNAGGANVAVPSLDDTAAVTLTAAVADLRLAKIGTPATQHVGQNVVFTLTLANDGPNNATNVTVSDTLPSGFTYVSSSAAVGTYNATSGLWTVGELNSTGSGTLAITATVNAAGSYTNYAQVATSDEVDGDSTPGNNSSTEDDDDSVTISVVPVADLRLAKAGTPASQYVGQSVVFTLTLANDGPSAASGVTVNDLLPSGFTYSASGAGQGTYNNTTGLWTVGNLGKNAVTTLVITATVNAEGSYTNYAQVASSDQYDGDSTPGNDSTTEDDDDAVTTTAVPVADLRLAKTGTPATQYVGQNVVFTLTLTNDGPNAASGVTVKDLLPSGFTYSSASANQGTYNNITGLWTVGGLSKDAGAALVITATVSASGSYTNYAEVAHSDQHDGDSTPGNSSTTEDDDDSATITVVPVADLRLAKIGTPSSQFVGQNVVFTLTLTNDGPSAASGVTVRDLLPNGFTYSASTAAQGTYSETTGLWTVGSLEKDAGTTLVVTATVNAGDSYTNYAQVASSDQYDGDSTPGNDSITEDDDDSVTITAVPVADLHLAKIGTPSNQHVGQNVVFTLTLTNDGPNSASGVTVSDLLPSGFTYVASLPSVGTYTDTTGLWTAGSLDKDASAALVITATVNATGDYTNYAEVAGSDQHDGDSTPGNKSTDEDDDDSVTITAVPVADLRLAKTGTPATQYVGQNVVFTLTVTNDGPSAASSVTVSDLLPSGFAYVDSSTAAGTYAGRTGLWTVGSLDKDASTTLVITATVNAVGSYTNYAQVAHSDQHDADSTPADNSTTEDDDDSVTIAAVPVADLRLTKIGTPATQYVGENVAFTLTLTNDGPSAATGVTVTDLLPSGFTYVDSLPADGTYDKDTGAWTVANLDTDEDTTLVIMATVNAVGSYTNYAEIKSANQYDGDSTPGNASTTEDDDESVTITAVPVADLRLAKTGSPAAQDVGQNVVFTLTVTNDGPSAASGVTVSDTLPSGFTYSDSLAGAGSYDKDFGLWTVGSLSKDASTTLVITATVNAVGDYLNNAEVAHSDQYDGNSTAGNRSTTEDDDDSFTVTPVPVIDLQLVETGNPATQYVGQTVVFTLTLTNDGPSAASGVTVSDTPPGGFTYQDSLPADGTYDKDTGVWTVGSLAKDAATTLVITATVNAGGSYTNSVEVASAGERDLDSTPANSSTTEDDDDTFVVTPVPVADLHLEKTGAPARQQVGQNVAFTLTLTNDGPSSASAVTVTDLLPNGFTYVGALAAAGAYDKDTGLWTVGSLNKGVGTSLVITATVNASGTYTNYAEVTSSAELDLDSTPANGSTTEDDDGEFVVTPTSVADLSLIKTGNPAVQYVGQTVVFTLTVANGGPSAASNVMVSDTLPSGFTYADSLASAGSYDSGSGLWTVGGLDLGANAALVVTATLNATGSYTNYAEVTASDQIDNDSIPANNSTTEDDDGQFAVNPVALVDLSLAKTGYPAVQYVGQNVVFTLTLANGGPSAASGVVVSDLLPSGFTYIGSLGSAGSYIPGNGTWVVDNLNAGADAALVLTVTVNATGTYTNYAEIAAVAEVDRDSLPGNHSTTEDDNASFVVTPVPVVDLSLAKSGAPLAPIIGRSIVFSLTVANAGPSRATDITVRDPLPSGYTFVATQASAGSYTGGLWTLGSLDAGAAATLQISATVNISGTYANYAEIASCGQIDLDSTPGNNSTTEDDDDSITPVPVMTAAIGNYVWLDANQDGVQGAGEGGVSGVMVQLFRANNTPVTSKLTDGAGKYEFTGLQPGDYYLQFTLPSGYVATLLDAPAALGDTADSDGGADGKTPVTNLASGENDLTWDFGLVLPAAPAAIGDTVWLDTDMDGLQDAGESGVPGVSVQLFKAGNTPVAAVATDAAGHYLFSNLSAGDYYLLYTPPAGYAVSPKDASAQAGNDALTGGTLDSDVGADGKTPVTSLVAGETDSTWDLGLYLPAQPGTLGGSVWLDTVQDGLQGAAESGVSGVAVQLYRAGSTLVAGTLTDTAGGYYFANLPPGDYYIQIVPPVGYLITTPDAAGETGSDPATGGSGDSDAGIAGTMPVTNLAAGETDLTWDAGIYLPAPPASVGSYVWLDVNHDGIQDAGETGVAGVTVQLFNQAGALLTAAPTDAEGRYRFANLPPGAYYLHFVLPAGYTISPLDAASGDAAGDAVDSDADQVTGLTVPFTLAAGEQSLHWSMGLVLPALPASLGDRVWLDTNRDGVQDITEQGVPAVTVHLLDAAGAVVRTTTTGDSGKYIFDNLPAGAYALQFVPPSGYSLTKPDVLADFADSDPDPATGRTVTFTLASGQRNPTLDAGLYLPAPPVSIGHLVWYDSDHDGLQDTGETGVPGVPVMVYRADGTFVAAAITDNTGSYRFDRLPAGDYYIRFVPPALYTITPHDAGTDDALDSDANPVTGKTAAVTFSPGVADLTCDLGLYLPIQPSVFSGDTWIDINNNGIQEAGEPPVTDVVVKLFDAGNQPTADGTLLAETKTGADGRYEFDNLAQGAYYLAFMPKPGYAAALADVGSDSFDSDANVVTGRTAVHMLAAGERADSVSAGYVPLLSVGDLVYNDFHNNGVYEPVEDDGVDGVKVNIYHDANGDGALTDADGAPVATTITDNGGRYLFTGLTPGDYVVELDDSNFAEDGLIRMFASSLSSRNAASEPITDPDNDVDGDDNGYDSHAPDGGVDIVSPAISLAFDAEPITDGDLNPSSNLSLDFGIYDPTVGNRVWLDHDMDGVQDAGETGIAAVVMNIYLDSNTNGMLDEHDRYLRSLTTDADGVYLFTFLAPGDYVIQVAPANFEAGGVLAGWHPAAGGSDPDDDVNTDSNGIADAYGGVSALAITLTSGGEPIDDGDTDEFTNLTVDFGFWPDPSTLGDYVWWDYNKDGVQDVGELPVAGVTVTLYSTAAGAAAEPLAETKTDHQGKYLFDGVVPGSYYIQFTVPPQYGITRFQAGSSRSADSDVNVDGKTSAMHISAGTDDRDCDLGLIYPTAENEVPEPGSADNLFLPLLSH